MLNMLIMLYAFWTYRPFQVHPRNKKKTNIQHYSCERHTFQKCASFSWNVEYVERVLGGFPKNASFSCNVEYADYVECFLNLQPLPGAPQKKKNIQRYSCEKHIFQNMCFFLRKCWICWMCSWNVFRKCASFWGNVEYVECFWNLQTPFEWGQLSSKYIQHIQHDQHIQHFPRKKHFSKTLQEHIQHIQHFRRKKHVFWKICFFQL